jgi:hypothetical protein
LMFNSPIGGGVHVCTGDGDGALTIWASSRPSWSLKAKRTALV